MRVPLKLDRMPKAYRQTEADLHELDELLGDDVEERPQLVEGSDESLEAFQIDDEDTVLVTCRSSDIGMIDEVVYNPIYNELVLHHSVDLPFLPLTVQTTNFRPGSEQVGGVHCVVAGFGPEIEFHDLNLVDEIAPEAVLAAQRYFKGSDKPIRSHESHNGAVLSSAWSPLHPNILLTGGEDGAIKFWELSSEKCIQTLEKVHEGPVGQLQFVNKAQCFFSAGVDDKKLKYFDFTVNQKDPIWETELPAGIESLQLAGDGLCVLGTSDGRVFVVSQEKHAAVAEAKVFGDD